MNETRSSTPARALFAGPLLAGSTTCQRLRAIEDLGATVHQVTTERDANTLVQKPSLARRLRNRLLGPGDVCGANARILTLAGQHPFRLLWLDKGLTIRPRTLALLRELQPECRVIGFSPDDMMNRGNQSMHFLRGLSLYHHFLTTKSYNVAELHALGCPNVIFMDNAYDFHTHRPVAVTGAEREAYGGPVGFIGTWEQERATCLAALVRAGIHVRVWGGEWDRLRGVASGMRVEGKHVLGEDYARCICSFDINLCFLRKCNRDLQTTRSVEIPACGGFMLAERTDEHRRLFQEGVEADYFSSPQELVKKVQYYLSHPHDRRTIAQRGHERCIQSGYSYRERLTAILLHKLKLL